MLYRFAIVLCVVCLLVSGIGTASAVVVEDITPLGVYPIGITNSTIGMGVNLSGQVVGYGGWTDVSMDPWMSHGWYYNTGGPLSDIGNLKASPFTSMADYNSRPADNVNCQVNGINAAGVAAGFAGNGAITHAFTYSSGSGFTDLGALSGVSRAYGINSNGDVAGASQFAGGGANDYHVVRWTGPSHTMTDLGTLEGPTTGAGVTAHGIAINSSGAIVGYGNYVGSTATQYHAFIVNGSAFTEIPSTLGGASSWARGVNDSGVVVGYEQDSAPIPNSHAFRWTSGGGVVDLGFLPGGTASRALGINNSGIIVGDTTISGAGHAMIWTAADGLQDLNSMLPAGSGWTSLTNADGISDNGWVTGTGVYGGVQQAFRLRLALPGDANLDSKVDINDLSKVLTNYDQTDRQWADGDFNHDGKVDINDLSIVLTNYDKSLGASAVGIAAVPEPCALVLLAAGLIGLLAYVWRRAS